MVETHTAVCVSGGNPSGKEINDFTFQLVASVGEEMAFAASLFGRARPGACVD